MAAPNAMGPLIVAADPPPLSLSLSLSLFLSVFISGTAKPVTGKTGNGKIEN